MSMSSRALLATASLVLLGAALGVAGDRFWLAHRPARVQIVLDNEHRERFRALLADMDLSEAQRASVDSILAHYQDHVEHSWNAMQPVLQNSMDSARRAITALFTPDQRATFDRWIEGEHRRLHASGHPFSH